MRSFKQLFHLDKSMMKPAVPSAVAYRHMRSWQQGGVKLAEQCTPSSKGVSRIREEEGESASITRKGTRLEGKVKVTELLITSVTKNKPKMLIGLSQKASGRINHSLIGLQGHSTTGI